MNITVTPTVQNTETINRFNLKYGQSTAVPLDTEIFPPTTDALNVARAVPTIILYSPYGPVDRRRRRRPAEFSLCWRDRVFSRLRTR